MAQNKENKLEIDTNNICLLNTRGYLCDALYPKRIFIRQKMPDSTIFNTSIDKRGFIHTIVAPGAEIHLEHAKKNTDKVIEVSGGSNYPILVDIREIKSVSKEARDHFAMKGRKPNVTAIAMLIGSPVSSLIGNFFLGLNKPVVPTRLFTNEKEAILWMKNYTETGQE